MLTSGSWPSDRPKAVVIGTIGVWLLFTQLGLLIGALRGNPFHLFGREIRWKVTPLLFIATCIGLLLAILIALFCLYCAKQDWTGGEWP
jgi:hypothetical protein